MEQQGQCQLLDKWILYSRLPSLPPEDISARPALSPTLLSDSVAAFAGPSSSPNASAALCLPLLRHPRPPPLQVRQQHLAHIRPVHALQFRRRDPSRFQSLRQPSLRLAFAILLHKTFKSRPAGGGGHCSGASGYFAARTCRRRGSARGLREELGVVAINTQARTHSPYVHRLAKGVQKKQRWSSSR